MKKAASAVLMAVLALPCLSGRASAEDAVTIPVTIENHRYTPEEIHIPAGKEVVLQVENRDPSAEEFESSVLNIEKVIAGGHRSPVRLHGLAAGRYPFIGEFHQETAHGVIISE